jgi:hypothetical protein
MSVALSDDEATVAGVGKHGQRPSLVPAAGWD